MDQLLQSARIITTISEMQQTIETIQSQLLAMRMSGADLGLLKDALGILGDCESELCNSLGEEFGHDKLMDALDAMQFCEVERV